VGGRVDPVDRLVAVAGRTMGNQGNKRKSGAVKTRTTDGDGEDGVDRAFDLWLQRGLHRLYDSVAKEPLPEELLRLIEQDRASRPAAASGGSEEN
jgi:hypothetical protein